MPYVQMSYMGWSEDWLEDGDPKVDEAFIKSFVNRYFAYPEDWDNDDVPLIMFWGRCITCGVVQEHFMRETEEAWENYIYNWDNTYTSLSDPECQECKHPYSHSTYYQEDRMKLAEEEYQYLLIYDKNEKTLQFGSELEEYFWKAWRIAFPNFVLIPQYPISNYFVDFAHIPTKTAIELDGKPFHSTQYQQTQDQYRQQKIERQGWRFIRFQGGDINYHVDRCIVETFRFLSLANNELINLARYQWRSSPSARLLMRLKNQNKDFIGDVP